MHQDRIRLEEMIRVACLWEATARKPGNVHPAAAFVDLTYDDFVQAANVVAPVLARSEELGVGPTVLAATRATREALGRNVNLGIVLLIAPLAAVPPGRTLAAGIGDILEGLDNEDAALVYEAIRLAAPGGMGTVEDQDVATAPTESLLAVMKRAAEWDQIAAEYANEFGVVLDIAASHFENAPSSWEQWNTSIIHVQLKLMTRFGDSLIARKCGAAIASEAQQRAQRVLDSFEESADMASTEVAELDVWLRGDGHRRNPGTTADLIAAILFAAFRDGHADFENVRQTLNDARDSAAGQDILINERRR
ncbi:ATP:dephospho-CoA triphosphoribosyl transferase [Symmachiella macrocystis]|uniref:ATP:dephospho-CoA triphosphoribosyl transferase n=1 Tax=Symmachiella macrocystis TaxID=2527985 RepID=A0A5C6BNP5_9PLAN|nr:triphosphoribosyl-dephospho-CoA synthase [Symmachiella macrocystis]TWU13658.1 ATP:dephospho-CoA triphosphoribosyl transferase [Symmachiella macrocystis]